MEIMTSLLTMLFVTVLTTASTNGVRVKDEELRTVARLSANRDRHKELNKITGVPANGFTDRDDELKKVQGEFEAYADLIDKIGKVDLRFPDNSFEPCGAGLCFCSCDVADCSNGSLTRVPHLPPDITQLNFSNNGLTSIADDRFFENCTNVTGLDLSFNELRFISQRAFHPFANLTFLSLEENKLTYSALDPVFLIGTLRILILGFNDLGPLPKDFFQKYNTSQLDRLDMNGNTMNAFDMKSLAPLSKLNLFQMSEDSLGDSIQAFYLPQLKILDSSVNGNLKLIQTCANSSSESLFPGLTDLVFTHNSLTNIDGPVCLPKLRTLTLSFSMFQIYRTSTFNADRFPSLQVLGLHRMTIPEIKVEKRAFSNPTLRWLYMPFNQIDFAADVVDVDCFAGCPNMIGMDLGTNDFSGVNESRFRQLFSHVTGLRYLVMMDTKLKKIEVGMFGSLTKLFFLFLDDNKLTYLPDGVFDALTELAVLSLSDNRLSIIKEFTFSAELRSMLLFADISDNPFDCSCDLRWFKSWLISNPELFNGSLTYYMCDNMPGGLVQSFFVADQACLLSRETSILIISVIAMLIVSMTMGFGLFRYRWHIRLMLYEAFRGRGNRLRRLMEEHFEYDVFVSYDQDDLPWVRQHLMPELEERLGMRLCIHERDFIPGKNIVDNISDCVEASKKSLMLFSISFARSPWCQFELNFCLNYALENDDALVVVFLHDIPVRDLTPAMMAVMRTTTYIEWVDEPEGRACFWQRLQLAFNEILPRG